MAKIVIIALAGLLIASPAQAQRTYGGPDWRPLAEQRFSKQADRLEFVGQARWGRLAQLQVRALDGPVRIENIRVRFADNREVQEIPVHQTLRTGEETVAFDLEGGVRPLEVIVVNLRPRHGPGQVSLAILGGDEPRHHHDDDRYVRDGRDVFEPSPSRGGWNRLVTRSFNKQADRIEFIGEARWGRIAQLQVRVLDGPVRIENIRVRFADNRAMQEIPVHQTLRTGEETFAFELEGGVRPLEVIVVNLRPRNGFGQAAIEVYGTDRSEHQFDRSRWSEPPRYYDR